MKFNLFRSFFYCFACLLLLCSCFKKPEALPITQAAQTPLPTAPSRQQEVRTPLPNSQQAVPINQTHDFEDAKLENVLSDGTTDFDPFTFGRAGSPYGPRGAFATGQLGGQCGPMDMPMSAQFADPGDKQAVIIIHNNGAVCVPDIDHDKPDAALTFPLVSALFTNAPWRILSSNTTQVTITNGSVTIRFEYRITSDTTFITKVEFL